MDPVVNLAARALAAGDPLAALKRVALRDDPPSLALRGIAMAQLGEWRRARELLQRAARAFGPQAALARARCLVAEAEIALASRDLRHDPPELQHALAVLDAEGDRANAALGRLTSTRRALLLGRLDDAERMLAELGLDGAPPHLIAVAELVAADIASRKLHTEVARDALGRAQRAAQRAKIPALQREVQVAHGRLRAPVARLRSRDGERLVRLDEVEALFDSGKFVVDACRRELRANRELVSLVDRSVLFELLWALSDAHPGPATREGLLWRAFGLRRSNESTRVRLRVEIGRLRKVIAKLADVHATREGFVLEPRASEAVFVLAPPSAGEGDALLALLRSGEPWSTADLASALGKSQRSVQRALGMLEARAVVYSVGKGRTRRWLSPPFSPFATAMLLVAAPAPR
jgi:hypothetical protein